MKIIDKDSYDKLNEFEKEIFKTFRDTILGIFPSVNNDGKTFDDLTIEYAERFGFSGTKILYPKIEETINTKIDDKIEDINKKIDELSKLLLNNTTGNGQNI